MSHGFSPTRPSGPSWSSSRHVRVSVCLCVCPLPMQFFSRPLIGPQIGPQQLASLTSSSICNFLIKKHVQQSQSKASHWPSDRPSSSMSSSICNFLMKTCVAKPVGLLEELRNCGPGQSNFQILLKLTLYFCIHQSINCDATGTETC